jgi:hypothetical protein
MHVDMEHIFKAGWVASVDTAYEIPAVGGTQCRSDG